jgi:hypothetical protein
MSKTIIDATEKVNKFFVVLEDRVERNIKLNIKTQSTKFAKEICNQFDMDWQVAYHLIGLYLSYRQDLYVKNGSKGGIDLVKNK